MPFVLLRFHRAKTSFDLRKPAMRLVACGPYSYSRNPAYVALALLYLAVSAAVESAWLVGAFLPAALAMHYVTLRRRSANLHSPV